MTGFEVAGLILAVIPLILEGIKTYPKTAIYKSAASFVRATQERRKFASNLLLLHSELRFVMIQIMKPLNPSLTPEQREILTGTDTVGARFFEVWKQVSEARREAVQKAYRPTIEHIKPMLHDMVKMLSEMLKHSEISYDAGREVLKAVIKNHSDGTLSITKNLAKRFKFAKSDPRRSVLIDQMRENIKLLKTLVKGQEQLTNFVADGDSIESQLSQGPFLDTVRGYSRNLYDALSTMWRCSCHKSPSAMLRLERRETPEVKASELLFSLVLTFEHSSEDQATWAFRETQVYVSHKSIIPCFKSNFPERRKRLGLSMTKTTTSISNALNTKLISVNHSRLV